MATNDVPGANPVNNDELHVGCWAEHADGSLILVMGLTKGRVVYSIFDLSTDPPVEYRDAMPEDGFKKDFSFASGKDKWTWHDKTEFPWNRVMKDFKDGSRFASANDLINAAQRVVKSRSIRSGAPVTDSAMGELKQEVESTLRTMMRTLQDAIGRLGR